MKDIIQLDENNICVSANCIYAEDDKTIEHEFETEEERTYFFENIKYFKYVNEKLVEMTDEEKEQYYPPISQEPTQLDRIEKAVSMLRQDVIDEYTLSLINDGVIK